MALGKNSFCLQLRRPLYAICGAVYRECCGPRRGPLSADATDELLVAVCVLSGCVVDWRAAVDPVVVSTDASETGGGSAVSTGLTDFAREE